MVLVEPSTASWALWYDFQKDRNVDVRNELVLKYIDLVKIIIYRLSSSYNHIDFDDMMSYGVLGLIDAIEKFDLDKGVKFETYASLRIRGAILDHIRQQDWAPRSLRQKMKKINEAYHLLEMQKGYSVSDEEVATFLQIKADDLRKTLCDFHMLNIISFDDILAQSYKSDLAAQSLQELPEDSFQHKELTNFLSQSIDQLSEKEKMVIHLYYYEELTLKEIGRILEVSESRISQLHSKALTKLRTKLSDYNDNKMEK